MNNIPLSHTGLYDPFLFDNFKCTKDLSSKPIHLNTSFSYGKIGKNQIFDRMRFFFNSNKTEKYEFAICENRIR